MSTPKPLRAQCQIQIAHDIMHAIAAKEIDIGIAETERMKYHIAHDVLSWVLEGPCGYTFQEILVEVMKAAEARGYTLERVQ